MSSARRLIALALLSIAVHAALLVALPGDGRLVEAVYTARVYPVIGSIAAFVPRQLPFSLAAVLLLAGAVWLPGYLGLNLWRWRRGALTLPHAAERTLAGWAAVAAVVFHGFYLTWGYNYLRPPIEQRLNLVGAGLSPDSLDATARHIVGEAVAHRVEVPPWDRAELDRLVDEAVARAVRELEGRDVPVVSPLKGDWPPGLLAPMGVRGVISPLTLEPHVDFDLPPFIVPFAAAHEKAHLAGFAGERDANFVAWYALVGADDPRLRYAGFFGVVSYFLTPETRAMAGSLEPDLQRLREYRSKRTSTTAQRHGLAAYRLYLRANRVQSGLADYSEVAGLIQAWREAGVPRN